MSPSTTELYPLSLHDALPIFAACSYRAATIEPLVRKTPESGQYNSADARTEVLYDPPATKVSPLGRRIVQYRSEEHTSELQSHSDLVCRLLLEKKKKKNK